MEQALKSVFGIGEVRAGDYSPLALAYIGDCAYEIVVRTLLLHKGNAPVDRLNRKASALAKAGTQARMITAILPELDEEEQAVYRRGRNAKSYTTAKNATLGDYHKATGFEAVIGWLYLKEEYQRMAEVIRMGFEAVEAEILEDTAAEGQSEKAGLPGTVSEEALREETSGETGNE